jgi:cephalosporin hydroxylase
MNKLNSKLKILETSWKKLKRLRPISIELERLSLIRDKNSEFLSDSNNIKSLMLDLGLNDDGLEEIPKSLHPYCGQGLRIWQYPIQFSKYLVDLSKLKISSYMEVGIRHGGTFVTTVEYLDKFYTLNFAVGIDIMPCPSMAEYKKNNPKIDFIQINTQTIEFSKLVDKYGRIDLIFIDSNHEESECRNEFLLFKEKANIIVLHDITSVDYPGIKQVWNEVKSTNEYNCFEYTEQYEGLGPHMGIGMAVRKDREV